MRFVVGVFVDCEFVDRELIELEIAPTPYPPSLMNMALGRAKRGQRGANMADTAVDTFMAVSGPVCAV